MSALQKAAMEAFSTEGFNAASMRKIGERAGLRPSSIYSHYRGKDALFLSLIAPAFEEETRYAVSILKGSPDISLRERLGVLLEGMDARYSDAVTMRFLCTVKYLPPENHHQAVDEAVSRSLSVLADLIERLYSDSGCTAMPPRKFALAFLALYESLEAEFIYSDRKRREERFFAVSAMLDLAFRP